MKKLITLIVLLAHASLSGAQVATTLHYGKFNKKGKFSMSSNSYKPDEWEKSWFDNSIKTAFPSDLLRFPEKYKDKLIHLIGIVDSVYTDTKDSSPVVHVLLENRYWDYLEDYSIQDEVMFISEKGDGKFSITLTGITPEQLKSLKKFPAEKKLFFVYGNFTGTIKTYPIVAALQIKFIDYEWYTDKIYSYEVKRDNNGNVATDKKGKAQITNFSFFKVATAGQNK